MKKLLAMLLVCTMVFSMAACGAKEEKPAASDGNVTSNAPAETPAEDNSTETKLLTDSIDLNSWSEKIIIGSSEVEKIAAGSKLEITTSPSADGLDYYQIKLSDGSWGAISPKGTIVGAKIENGLIVLNQNTGIISYTFTSDEAKKIKDKGFVIQGCGVTINKIILVY